MLWQLTTLSNMWFQHKSESLCKYFRIFDLRVPRSLGNILWQRQGSALLAQSSLWTARRLRLLLKRVITQIHHFHLLSMDFLFADFRSTGALWDWCRGLQEKGSALTGRGYRHPPPGLFLRTCVPASVCFCCQGPTAPSSLLYVRTQGSGGRVHCGDYFLIHW